jgi:hypothetical protein
MESLASFHVFNLDDSAFPLAHSVDRVHAKAAITDKPGHH